MNVGISGATGLIGHPVASRLQERGAKVIAFGRSPTEDFDFEEWNLLTGAPPVRALEELDAFIHLAGESIVERWTDEKKRRIRRSRVEGTRQLVRALEACEAPPQTLISASAIGFYGDRGDEIITEASEAGEGFLAEVAVDWEREARRAEELGVRVVLLRTGIVLSTEGGALAKMLTPFKMGVGGRLGNGRQYMSWIHLEDEIRLIEFLLGQETIRGPVNATAPEPVTNAEFTKTLGKTLGRPTVLPVPGVALKLLMGEMAEDLLLEGQRVIPEKAREHGYPFQFPELSLALEDLLQS